MPCKIIKKLPIFFLGIMLPFLGIRRKINFYEFFVCFQQEENMTEYSRRDLAPTGINLLDFKSDKLDILVSILLVKNLA
jgi:hypothetical protein